MHIVLSIIICEEVMNKITMVAETVSYMHFWYTHYECMFSKMLKLKNLKSQ